MKAYYFAPKDNRLRYGDGRKIGIGRTHKVKGKLKLCGNGLHASLHPFDALEYAPYDTKYLYEVELSGGIIKGEDKLCASERTYLKKIKVEDVLRKFARQCALDVVHLWDAPDVVIKYLKTGDESLRDAASDASSAASASDATWAANAAANAAAVRAASGAAWAAANTAASDAAWAAAIKKQRARFKYMVTKEFKK